MPKDPIQVYENYDGPIPSPQDGGLRYGFIAYRDAERDHGLYGYGHTERDAIADFVRNEAEADCSSCPGCEDDRDCILTSGKLSRIVANEFALWQEQTP